MGEAGIAIRAARPEEAEFCEEILRSLPEWFGIESAIDSYRADIENMETIVAVSGDSVRGFLTLNSHGPHSSEIQVMAVRREGHRAGVGRALVQSAEELLAKRGTDYLQVKTLGPSRPNEEYARTRLFYEGLGFLPIEENELWGSSNPCLILVKHLRCAG